MLSKASILNRVHSWIDYFGFVDFPQEIIGYAHMVALGSMTDAPQRPDISAVVCYYIASMSLGSPFKSNTDERLMKIREKQRAQFWTRKKKYDVLHHPDGINFSRLKERANEVWKFNELV